MFYLAVFFAACGGILSGFDTGVISGALLYIDKSFELDEYSKGFLVSTVLIGAILGAFLNGKLSDIFGRKKMIFMTGIIFFLGSVFCALSTNVYYLMLSRFIVGFAIGIITFLAPMYLSEISPDEKRGFFVSTFQLAITAGILISYLTNAFFAPNENWRLMFLFGTIPAAILCFGIYFMPDTPRWYILCGQIEKAKEVLLKFNLKNDINSEIEKIKTLKSKKIKFEKWMIYPVFIGIGAMFIQQGTGINTIIYYAPTILKYAGFNDNLSAIYATIGIGVVNFLMTFPAMFLGDKAGRKPLLYFGLSGMGICLLVLSLSFKFSLFFGSHAKYLALFSTIFYIMFFSMSLGPILILLVSEIFPLKIRGLMMSISMAFNFIFNFLVSLLFLPMMKNFGEFKTFLLFSIISFLSIIFVKLVIFETKGKSLEDIELNLENNNV